MAYFKIGDNDYSAFVNGLEISTVVNYTEQQNAAGDSVVDYINKKRVIEISVIPLSAVNMEALLQDMDSFNVSISYREPKTGALVSGVNCIISKTKVEYYTIQENKVMYKESSFTFTEL